MHSAQKMRWPKRCFGRSVQEVLHNACGPTSHSQSHAPTILSCPAQATSKTTDMMLLASSDDVDKDYEESSDRNWIYDGWNYHDCWLLLLLLLLHLMWRLSETSPFLATLRIHCLLTSLACPMTHLFDLSTWWRNNYATSLINRRDEDQPTIIVVVVCKT